MPASKHEAKIAPDAVVTVCSECLRASCWLGYFYCDNYRSAGLTTKTVSDLRKINREHPCYWRPDMEAA